MDKQTLTRDIKSSVKDSGFINISQLARYLQKSRENTVELLRGLEYIEVGREKKFFISDVAGRLIGMRQIM